LAEPTQPLSFLPSSPRHWYEVAQPRAFGHACPDFTSLTPFTTTNLLVDVGTDGYCWLDTLVVL
jgi:hypothetical protein